MKPLPYLAFVENLSAAIRAARETAGLSQEAVAHAAGLSVRHLQKIESGATANPKLENLHGVAAALGLRLSRLAAMAEEPDRAS